ncbi:MAG: colicin M resistance protein CbrA, partial [Oscillospiraceae bacterium]|nr:colicin M resistance protein CbrA [Oscillospiraceae bacterium]
EEQKKRLAEYDFEFGKPIKTEACIVLRPKSPFDICTGRGNAFLIGEAAGLISPSSLEGISFAINSARLLAETLNSGTAEISKKYAAKILPLKLKILVKILKCPFMYDPTLRKLVMKSGISSINVRERS